MLFKDTSLNYSTPVPSLSNSFETNRYHCFQKNVILNAITLLESEDISLSFDGLFTHAMVHELAPLLTGGRVARISQPYPNELILTVRAQRHNYPLLLSAHPNYARVQVTEIPFVNPATPTKFTMSLRKYLDGAILTSLKQVDNDRVVQLTFQSRNELGDLQGLTLIVELMGRRSNIILIRESDQRILDTIKHIASDQNRYRLLLPGVTYIAPPQQDRADPFQAQDQYYTQLDQTSDLFVPAKQLQTHYQGLGFDSALELATRLKNSPDQVQTWTTFLTALSEHPEPTITTGTKQLTFSPLPYGSQKGPQTHYATLSEMLDHFYRDKSQNDRVRQQGSRLIHFVTLELKKDRKKMKKLQQTLASSDKADDYRVKGELLTTYLYQVQRGMTTITLPNYYDNEKPVKIALSNQLTPSRNAQKYFTKYQKLKNSVAFVTEQMQLTQAEIDYFSGILAQIEIADPKDLVDIEVELQQQGYLKAHHKKHAKNKRVKPSQPERFKTDTGVLIEVGKNNLQNERLTLKTAQKTDTWLHAKNIPGSHVIIHDSDPDEDTILVAANLAAYFSKSRLSASVPVDYVQVKKIRKPNGTKPGFVIYEGQHTCYVTPDEKIVAQLRANAQK